MTGRSEKRGLRYPGRLERVNDLGILGAFADEAAEEEPVRSFYPWAAALQVAKMDDVGEVIGIR